MLKRFFFGLALLAALPVFSASDNIMPVAFVVKCNKSVCEGKAHIYNIYRYSVGVCQQKIGFHCAE